MDPLEKSGAASSGLSSHTVACPTFHFGGINLSEFQPVIAYDISKKNVVMQV